MVAYRQMLEWFQDRAFLLLEFRKAIHDKSVFMFSFYWNNTGMANKPKVALEETSL